jgi:hypothetical protein
MRVSLISSQIVTVVRSKSYQLLRLFPSRRTTVSRQAIAEYINGLIKLYREAVKGKKTEYLDQAEAITGKSRRTVLRYLGSPPGKEIQVNIQGRGRQPLYEPELLLPHIRTLWKAMEMISAERMVPALPKWLAYYEDPTFTDEVKGKLLSMSRCTLERFLVQIRGENITRKGLSATTSALGAFKTKVPINNMDHQVTRPGFTQADTVAHCSRHEAVERSCSYELN